MVRSGQAGASARKIVSQTVIGTVILLVVLLYGPIRGLWTIWRLKASAFSPIVLDGEGFLDRSIAGMPRIAWPDIAAINLHSGVMTLTGGIRKWAEDRAPDRRWFARWRAPRIPRLAIQHYGLQPDAEYAVSLIHAYWQRRVAGHAVDRIGVAAPTVQRG